MFSAIKPLFSVHSRLYDDDDHNYNDDEYTEILFILSNNDNNNRRNYLTNLKHTLCKALLCSILVANGHWPTTNIHSWKNSKGTICLFH